MARLIIILSLFLSGCGQQAGPDPAANNYGYGWDYDQSGDSGLRVHYMDGAAVGVDFSILEDWYLKMEACTGITAPGPLVAVTAQQIVSPTGTVAMGITYFDTGLIAVMDTEVRVGNPGGVLKHEMIHYLLWMSGFPNERNTAHDSPYFYSPTTGTGCELVI